MFQSRRISRNAVSRTREVLTRVAGRASSIHYDVVRSASHRLSSDGRGRFTRVPDADRNYDFPSRTISKGLFYDVENYNADNGGRARGGEEETWKIVVTVLRFHFLSLSAYGPLNTNPCPSPHAPPSVLCRLHLPPVHRFVYPSKPYLTIFVSGPSRRVLSYLVCLTRRLFSLASFMPSRHDRVVILIFTEPATFACSNRFFASSLCLIVLEHELYACIHSS